MPVADMDFPSAPPILAALRARVEHGFFGYGYAREDFHEAFTARLKRRMNWDVANDALIPIAGISKFAVVFMPASLAATPCGSTAFAASGDSRLRIGQIGTEHAHAAGKMAAMRSLPARSAS